MRGRIAIRNSVSSRKPVTANRVMLPRNVSNHGEPGKNVRVSATGQVPQGTTSGEMGKRMREPAVYAAAQPGSANQSGGERAV